MTKTFRYIMAVLLLLLGGSYVVIQHENTPQELIIASANPMSGNYSDAGEMKVKAIQLAIDQANAAGGIHGKKVKLLIGDDQSTPKEAYKLAQVLANNPDVLAVIGHWNSACTLAARNVYNGAGIPTVTDSVNQAITDGTTPYLFRILPPDTVQAEQLVEYAYTKLGFKKFAIIYVNTSYGKGMKHTFLRKIHQLGGEVTTTENYFGEATSDFTWELLKIRNSRPDSIFIAGYYTEAAEIAKQCRKLGINLPIIGTNAINSEKIITLGGYAVEGIRCAGWFHPSLDRPSIVPFVTAFRQRYARDPDSNAAVAYDAAQLVLDAIRINGPSREGIYNYLATVQNYPGVAGNIGFNSAHNALQTITILKIQNGRLTLDEQQI